MSNYKISIITASGVIVPTYEDMTETFSTYSNITFGDISATNYWTWKETPLTWAESKLLWKYYGATRWLLEVEEDTATIKNSGFFNRIFSTKKERIKFTDKLNRKSLIKYRSEDISVSETYWDNIKFKLRFVENIIVENEFINRYTSKNAKDVVTFSDDEDKVIKATRKEYLQVEDVFNRKTITNRDYTEVLRITPKEWRMPSLYYFSNFYIEDSETNNVNKNRFAVVTFSDNVKRTSVFVREPIENVNVSDELGNNVKHISYETFATYDSYLSPLNGTLSNLNIKETEMTLSDFESAVNTPPNYNKFVEFKVGEYEYQEALVRIRMNTKSNLAQSSASDVVMHVDIPDTDDRGTVNITDTSAATEVAFNKFYYTIPEVSVTLRGASTADGNIIPNIVSIATNKFEVELLSGGKRVKGTLSWVAKGY